MNILRAKAKYQEMATFSQGKFDACDQDVHFGCHFENSLENELDHLRVYCKKFRMRTGLIRFNEKLPFQGFL